MARIAKNPEIRRSELINSAQQLFFSKGYESTSVNDIIEAVGVSKGTFYYYFPSKEAVLEALVDEMTRQAIQVMENIAGDETLSALPKLNQAFQSMSAWKAARKEEMMAVARILYREENILLLHKIQVESIKAVSPHLANIIRQGIREGVFNTEFADESAQITFSILLTFSDSFSSIMLHPEWYDSPEEIISRQLAAMEIAIERILGAPPGSLTLFEPAVLAAWFGK